MGGKTPARGLYLLTPDIADTDALLARAQPLLAFTTWLQYRNKAAERNLQRQQLQALRPLCERAGVPLLVNDDWRLAAELGLPYAFAAHFAPAMLAQASEIYRAGFKPSKYLSEPYLIVCVNIVAAATTDEAQQLSTSMFNMFAGLVTNRRRPLGPPTEKPIYANVPAVERAVRGLTACTFIGDAKLVKTEVGRLVEEYAIDEIMTTNYIFDPQKRLDSFRFAAAIMEI